VTFLKSLFLNFLIVFFVNRVIPGIDVVTFEAVPDVIADFFFSLSLGFLNAAAIYLLLLLNCKATFIQMGLLTFIFTFGGFAIMAIFPLGVQIATFGGYFFASLIVWGIAFFSNYLEKLYLHL
jgi:hypothetical protein